MRWETEALDQDQSSQGELAQFLAAAKAATDREDLSKLDPERFEAGE